MSPKLRNRLLAIKRMAEQDIGNPNEQANAKSMLEALCREHGISEEDLEGIVEVGRRFRGQIKAPGPCGTVLILEGEFEDLGSGMVKVINARVVGVEHAQVTVTHVGWGCGGGADSTSTATTTGGW